MKPSMVLVALTLVPTLAWAQDTLHNWTALDPSGLSTVHVLDVAGQETTGRLLRLDADSVVVLSGGREQRVEAARVKRLAKRGDSLKNGAYLGALIGAALGLLADCQGCGAGRRAGGVGLSAGFFTGIGVGIDALKQGRTTLYEAPVSGSRPLPQALWARRGHAGGGAVNWTIAW